MFKKELLNLFTTQDMVIVQSTKKSSTMSKTVSSKLSVEATWSDRSFTEAPGDTWNKIPLRTEYVSVPIPAHTQTSLTRTCVTHNVKLLPSSCPTLLIYESLPAHSSILVIGWEEKATLEAKMQDSILLACLLQSFILCNYPNRIGIQEPVYLPMLSYKSWEKSPQHPFIGGAVLTRHPSTVLEPP